MKILHKITFLLLVIGGLNWGIFGVTAGKWEVGHILGGMTSPISMIIYILVGLSAIIELATHKKNCMCCSNKDMMDKGMMMKDGMMDKKM